MSNTIIGGSITLTMGSAPPITLTTDDMNATPVVFTLPEGASIDINIGDLNTYFQQNFPSIPTITLPTTLAAATLSVTSLTISSAGIFDIGISLGFAAPSKGWTIFTGLTINQVSLMVDFSAVPVITALSVTTGPTGTPVTITGNDLANATSVTFGSVTIPATAITNNTATSLTIAVPTGLTAAGSVPVSVTSADGTSQPPLQFNYTTS